MSRTSRARELRRESTDAERRLWAQLRDRRFEGLKFRRQQFIGPFFADFACQELKLLIELDGGQHAEPEQEGKDAERGCFLATEGYRVLHFWNNDVMLNLDGVLETIRREVEGPRSPAKPK